MRDLHSPATMILLIAASAAVAEGQQPSPFDAAGLSAYITTVARVGQLPAVVTAVVTPDGPVFEGSSGLDRAAGDEHGQGASGTDAAGRRFYLGAVSEMLTAFALMRLVDDGQIDLDAPVRRYLPDLAFADLARTEALTIRHLLTHRSGLPTMAYFNRRVQSHGRLDQIDFARDPGARSDPSGLDFLVLGMVLEAASGEPYARHMSQSVFEPLGMRSLGSDGETARGEVAVPGHRYLFGWPVAGEVRAYTEVMAPATHLASSARDLGRFLAALLNDGLHEGERLLSSAGVESLLPPVDAEVDAPERDVWAGGWMRVASAGPSAWYREGAAPGFHALIAVLPGEELGIIVLASRTGGPGPNATRAILGGVLDHIAGRSPRTYFPWELILHVALLILVVAWIAQPIRWHRRWREAGSPRAAAHTPPIVLGLATEPALAAALPLVAILGVAETSISWLLALYPDLGVAFVVFPLTAVPTAVWRCLVRSEAWRQSQVTTPAR